MTLAKLGTRKAHTVCKKWNFYSNSNSKLCLHDYTEKRRTGETFKAHFVEHLKNENWSLNVDGNRLKKKEYQDVVLKNENREVKLAVFELINEKVRNSDVTT